MSFLNSSRSFVSAFKYGNLNRLRPESGLTLSHLVSTPTISRTYLQKREYQSDNFGGLNEGDDEFFQRVLQRFPGQRTLSLAYGSGVFQQADHKNPRDNMTDFLIAVDDPVTWHKHNLQLNPKDYAGFIRRFGPKVISEVQDKWAARLYFNTLIPFESGLIKYGVISRNAFIADLLDWESLYAAGRLHKPVKILEKPSDLDDQELDMALRMNLKSAIHTALLLLPDHFSETRLYLTVANLSYVGDFRMSVGGEDKNKVSNIVLPMVPHFRTLYAKELKKMSEFLHFHYERTTFIQDMGPSSRHFHLSMLPKQLQTYFVRYWNQDGRWRDVEDVLRAAAYESETEEILKKSLGQIIGPKSITQAVKGIITAGPWKSTRYATAKVKKMLSSLKNKSTKILAED